MKNIETILNDYQIPEEAREAIAKEVRANYKTVADWQKKADRIAELEAEIGSLRDKASASKADEEELKALREESAARKKAEAEREAEEAEAADREAFRKKFDEALEGRKFANGIVEKAVFEAAYAQCKGSAGTSAAEAIKAAAGDEAGVWENPQTNPKKMPELGAIASNQQKGHEEKGFLDALFGPSKEK